MVIENYYKKYALARTIDSRIIKLKNEKRMINHICNTLDTKKKELDLRIAALDDDETLSDEEKRMKVVYFEKNFISTMEYYTRMKDLQGIINEAYEYIEQQTEDGENQEPEIVDDFYFKIMYKRNLSMILSKIEIIKSIQPKSEEEKLDKEARLESWEKKLTELNSDFSILLDKNRREEYDSELQKQEYIEELEENRVARIKLSEAHVKSVLGEDFNPDMSETVKKSKKIIQDAKRKGNELFRWKARLYERPEKLFFGKSSHPDMEKLDSDVYAFRYGTLEFASLFGNNDKPSYTDSLCEIIGVTKVDKNGEQRTDFVVAPLTEGAEIRDFTPEEYEQFLSGKNQGFVVKTQEEIELEKRKEQFLRDTERRQRAEVIKRAKRIPKKGFLDTVASGFRSVFLGEPEDDEYIEEDVVDMISFPSMPKDRKNTVEKRVTDKKEEKIHVYIPKTVKRMVLSDEIDFFSTVYFSDYLVDNAIKNNAGYLGSYHISDGKRIISYTGPMERERIAACYFAQEAPGEIVQEGRAQGIFSNSDVESKGTKSLFSFLKRTQESLVNRQITKEKTKVEKPEEELGV